MTYYYKYTAPMADASPHPPPAPDQSDGAELGIVDALAQLSFLVQGILAKHAASHEVSMIQTRLLGVLRDREPTMHELAKLLELDKSSVTGLVDRAERRGLVQRMPSAEDRRAIRVSLTASGRRAVAEVARAFETDISSAIACLSPTDQRRLAALATRILCDHVPST